MQWTRRMHNCEMLAPKCRGEYWVVFCWYQLRVADTQLCGRCGDQAFFEFNIIVGSKAGRAGSLYHEALTMQNKTSNNFEQHTRGREFLYIEALSACLLLQKRSEEHTSELQSLMRISYA